MYFVGQCVLFFLRAAKVRSEGSNCLRNCCKFDKKKKEETVDAWSSQG